MPYQQLLSGTHCMSKDHDLNFFSRDYIPSVTDYIRVTSTRAIGNGCSNANGTERKASAVTPADTSAEGDPSAAAAAAAADDKDSSAAGRNQRLASTTDTADDAVMQDALLQREGQMAADQNY